MPANNTQAPNFLTANTVMDYLKALPQGCPVSWNLEAGQSAWNPASTKSGREVYGPCIVTYFLWYGSVTLRVR